LHYRDGEIRELPIVCGVDTANWWAQGEPSEATNAQIAWTASTPEAAAQGRSIRLYRRTYENPRPEVEITQLDLVSANAYPALIVIAISVE
jgi:hypothetical protein